VTTDIEQFQFPVTGQSVRTAELHGAPAVVANDVCAVLQHSNPRQAVAKLPDHMKGVTEVDTPGGPQRMTVLTEAGVYRLVMRSNLPAAEAFQDWIAETVLPAIRKTGSYTVATLPDLTTAEGVLALAERFAETARDLVESEQARREMEPKAVAYDAFLSAGSGDRLVRQAAKELGLKEMDLRRFLLDQKLIFCREAPCGAKQYEPYAANAKHFKPVEKVVEHTWGTCAHFTLYIRPSGMDLVHRRLVAENSRYQAAIAATAQKGL